MNTVKIKVEDTIFTANFFDNPTAIEIENLLPLKLTMKELNNNEKYYNFPQNFSKNPQFIKQINKGDIMLYQDNCLVIFYKDFTTNIQYTPIGKINNVENLGIIGNSSDISVSFII
ncbi:hypothetical protein K1Y15_06380 [Mammaliicoccus sciuri]|uniref:cyclophilin-like fold protein n=1 Tax=Mammaliicoccus sciuri TaxID=1296 RepID=UPI001E6201DE|nr:cyclophilin-like fold protein [Mammaliicoccus sciuri]MCD8788803.1 hypothetical protein [Mammaliicoccus sciuri]